MRCGLHAVSGNYCLNPHVAAAPCDLLFLQDFIFFLPEKFATVTQMLQHKSRVFCKPTQQQKLSFASRSRVTALADGSTCCRAGRRRCAPPAGVMFCGEGAAMETGSCAQKLRSRTRIGGFRCLHLKKV